MTALLNISNQHDVHILILIKRCGIIVKFPKAGLMTNIAE